MIGTLFYFSPGLRRTSNMDGNIDEAHAARVSQQWPEDWLLFEARGPEQYSSAWHRGARVAVKRGDQWTAIVEDGRTWIAQVQP